ncbi:unnamed protein product [Malus baccata var. baccata]
MAYPSSSSSSSSGPTRRWIYDVFLNFSGEDTRKIFVSHLYKALVQNSINTFIDAEKLRKGNDLSQLLSAINGSRLSIVVFSQNYASSTWCMKELVQILECMDTVEQIVVPIFYQVSPTHVRKLQESFAESFSKQEQDSNTGMEELRSWRSALTRAANLFGWDSRDYKDDAKFIEDIVQGIFKKLINISSSEKDGLVGMDPHLQKMDLLLCPQVDDVRLVGIWCMGGIGKTTIARAVYDKIKHQFDGSCFLENVKGRFPAVDAGEAPVNMQAELLSSITNNKVGSSDILSYGFQVMLESMLSVQKQPAGEYNDLSSHFIKYAQGLPLALKILGAFLDNKSVLMWKDELKKIKRNPHEGIQKVLRTSFGGLDGLQKEICLDIACFFKQMKKDYATRIMEGCGFHPHTGLDVLVGIALVAISSDGILEMHDLLEEMGCEIVRQESIKEPERHSRLWNNEDVCHVLTHNTATEVVESIVVGWPNSDNVSLEKLKVINLKGSHRLMETPDFTKAKNLEKLILEGCTSLHGVHSSISALEKLVLLDLSWCNNLYTFASSICMKSLETLNLSFCSNIRNFPDIPEVMENLSELYLQGTAIWKLPCSINNLTGLVTLNLEYCRDLEILPRSIVQLKSLKFLNLSGCSKLECKELRSLPSIIHMRSLRTLNLSGCSNLYQFLEILEVMENLLELNLDETAISELPSSIQNLTGLVTLNLKGCRRLKILPSSIHMRSLQTLNLSGCSNLKKLPEFLKVMKNLSELHLDWTTIEDSPIGDLMRSLRTFGTQNFSGDMKDPSRLGLNGIAIVELPLLIYNLTGLVTLTLRHCKYFKGLSSRICQLKSLRSRLGLRTSIRELPPSIERLRGLVSLNLRNCKSFVYLLDIICNLLNLEWLTLNGCSKLSKLPEDLWYLKRLDVMGTGIHKDNNHGPTGTHPKLQFFSTLGELAQFRGTAPLSNVVDSSCEEKEAVGVGASLNDPEESSYVEGKEEEAVAVGAILSDLDESSHKEEEEEEEKVVAPSRRGGREDMVLHLWRTWHQNYMKIELSENSRDLGGGKNKDLAEWSLRFCRVLSWWLISVFCAVVKH